MAQVKQYNKEELREMLPEAFKRYREHPTLLVLSDTNIFADDPSGRSLAVKHSTKFHCRIFRFQNPEYAEGGSQEQTYGVIEDVEEEATSKPQKPSAKANTKKTVEPEPVVEEDEDDISANLSEQVKAEEKAAEAKKATSSGTKSGTTGIKAKK